MNRQTMARASALVVLVMLGVAIIVGNMTPDGVQLPTHWGIDGEPDRMSDKWTALLLPPLIAAVMSMILYAIPALEPKEKGLSRSQGLYLWSWIALLLIFATVDAAVVSEALGLGLPVIHLTTAGIGAALIMIGNQLGKSRPMFLIGVRTPWTLASEEVWIKTHRLAGKLMLIAGVLMLGGALLALPAETLAGITIAAVVVAAVVPVAYSYLLWRQEKRQGQPSE